MLFLLTNLSQSFQMHTKWGAGQCSKDRGTNWREKRSTFYCS